MKIAVFAETSKQKTPVLTFNHENNQKRYNQQFKIKAV
jgi:hypothetical protein